MAQGWGPRRASPVELPALTQVGRGGEHCRCGHLMAVHQISSKTKARTACTHMDAAGQCQCTRAEVPR